MDYPVSGRAPDTAPAVMPHVLNADGTVSPGFDPEGAKRTYSLSFQNALWSGGADGVTIAGATGKVIRIRRIVLTQDTNTGLGFSCIVSAIKRSTATTGGTSASKGTPVPHDSGDAAAGAVITGWSNTTGQSVGTSVGEVRRERLMFQTTNSGAAPAGRIEFDFSDKGGKSLILRSGIEILALQCDTSATFNFYVEWTEE